MSEPMTMGGPLEHSLEVDKEEISKGPSSDCSTPSGFWENDSSYSVSSVGSSPYDVSKLEASLYYFGIRGTGRLGPKLIYRTSKDVYTPPPGQGNGPRAMQLQPVYEHHKLGKNDLWATIRSQVVELLDERNIQHSSVDLVRFSWVKENRDDEVDEDDEDDEGDEDGEDDEDDGIDWEVEYAKMMIAQYRRVVTTPVTIWVGVLPDTLTGEVAFHSSNDILKLLEKHGITDVDVAYRESVVKSLNGPELLAPVWYLDPLETVISPVTTALGLPIAGLKTLHNQGTMGFYFRVGQDLCAVTARHVLFPEDQGNYPYSYVAGPRKEVVLMGTNAFTDFLTFIQDHIRELNIKIGILEREVTAFTARSEGNGPDAGKAALNLEETQRELTCTQTAIEEHEEFFMKMCKQWKEPKDRVIGQVVWAPPISFSTTPHGYTEDVCVVKLDKKKFSQNFRGNVLNLGAEIDLGKFVSLINPRTNAQSDFVYPADRLLRLRGILSAEEMRTSNMKTYNGEPVRYVTKRGHATLTTIGRLTGFESHVRRYLTIGSRDSVEAAVYPHDKYSGPFSEGGDSGSIIADASGKFVALLTAGTGSNDCSDITFGTPMYWLWKVIKAKFPGASLDFEDVNN